MGMVLPELCVCVGGTRDIQPLPQGVGGVGGAVGAAAEEEGNQAGEQVTAQIRVVVIPASTRAGRGDAVAGGEEEKGGGWGGRGLPWQSLHPSSDTNIAGQTHRACKQAHGETMCCFAAGGGEQARSKGARQPKCAHAHTRPHTHSFPTGDLSSLAFISWSAQEEKSQRAKLER